MPERICEEPLNGMQKRIEAIPIAEPVGNVAHKEPLPKVCVMNIDNLLNADDKTEMPNTDGTVLEKGGMEACAALHGMLSSRNHMDRSKPTS